MKTAQKFRCAWTELDLQIQPLIDEVFLIKQEAQQSKMTALEQDAHSMYQSLTALTKKLQGLQKDSPLYS